MKSFKRLFVNLCISAGVEIFEIFNVSCMLCDFLPHTHLADVCVHPRVCIDMEEEEPFSALKFF